MRAWPSELGTGHPLAAQASGNCSVLPHSQQNISALSTVSRVLLPVGEGARPKP